MSPGRCAGCGEQNKSCKVIKRHVLSCPEYLTLYRADPVRALDPEAEYRRWRREDDTPEAHLAAQHKRFTTRNTAADELRAAQTARYGSVPKDILE